VTLYPKATWFPIAGAPAPRSYRVPDSPWRSLLHTTETDPRWGVPDYPFPPHLTVVPDKAAETVKWYQHYHFESPSFALRHNSGDPETNHVRVIQLEQVCDSQKSLSDATPSTRIWVGAMPDWYMAEIIEYQGWIEAEFGVAHRWPGFQSFDFATSANHEWRLSWAEWAAWDGWLGHQHAPGQNPTWHWDPGAFKWDVFMEGADMKDERISDAMWAKIKNVVNRMSEMVPSNTSAGNITKVNVLDNAVQEYSKERGGSVNQLGAGWADAVEQLPFDGATVKGMTDAQKTWANDHQHGETGKTTKPTTEVP
jgi:hypothetical protein